MPRIISVNKFIDSRNKMLFRWPIHRKLENSQNQYSTLPIDAGAGLQRLLNNHCHLVNNVNRFKSSFSDSSTLKLQKFPAQKPKKRNRKVVQTTVTEVTDSSSTVKRESVGIFRKQTLTNFVANGSPANSDKSIIMREKPILFTPKDFEIDPEKNKILLENLAESFEKFLLANAKPFIDIDEQQSQALPEKLEPHETPKESVKIDSDLQKEFDKRNLHDLQSYQISLTQSLKAYINACISLDFNERAFSVLNKYRYKMVKGTKVLKSNDPELYADLMTKYAFQKNWNKVKKIYSILIEEKVPITPQVYMTMLDCLGRKSGHTSLIENCIKMAAEKGISLNDIMDKSIFVKDQRSVVLEVIRRHTPNFTPIYTPPQLGYNNDLLNFMNGHIQPIEKAPHETMGSPTGCAISNSKSGFSPEQLDEYAIKQFEVEAKGRVTVKNITMLDSTKFLDKRVLKRREILDNLMNQWRNDLTHSIQQRLNILNHKMRTESTTSLNIFPYLKLLAPEELADVLLDQLKPLIQGSEAYSSSVYQINLVIGKAVMKKHQMNLRNQNGIHQKIDNLYKTYRDILCSGKCSENSRQLWQRIIYHSRGDGPCLQQKDIAWPWPVQMNVGRMLFKILMENVKIDQNLFSPNRSPDLMPIVYTLFRNRNLKSREEIRIHPVLITLFRESKLDTLDFIANEVPMLCPPIPWTSINSGGYLMSNSDLVRLPMESTIQVKMIREAPPTQMYPSLDTLNQLGCVPWRINTRILDLAIKIFNLGGNKDLHVPLTPDSMLTDEQLEYRSLTRNDLLNKKKFADRHYSQEQKDLFSVYSDTLYKLSLANHFRDRPFWLPHNLDFRGRTYPIPPHLTHLSADLTRSMLHFHRKQPLGRFGLDWLKLHCINLTGLKKRESIQDRFIYAESVIDDIIDSADNPLNGRQWWLNSDDPWQTLAACMEIADAMRSPDPTKFMSSFPIHQDGSCNGLQHYAALGRDVDGAASVNLAPAPVPQDVYSTIANRVEEIRQRDANEGNPVAAALEGLVKRKIIKQTVMTTVYGVTRYGARLQIKKQLKNIEFDPKLIESASTYLADATFGSLSETFSSAREIQDWLTSCASTISKQNEKHVEWISPLGLPIIQPYTRGQTQLSSNTPLTKIIQMDRGINKMKEKNAFSPNFIHSLDSCHMMLTALNCERAGITFVSVHDCFWTHANTVPIMNRVCREQFVLLHSQPILENLGESFSQRFETVYQAEKKKRKYKKKIEENAEPSKEEVAVADHRQMFKQIPRKGNFDLKKVMESIYFFS